MLTIGNTAKFYCLDYIDKVVSLRTGSVTLLDIGCGAALNFVPLLRKHKHLRYIGIEPSESTYLKAKQNTRDLNAEIINQYAYSVKIEPLADIITSFSVFEHVSDRRLYLECAKANLAKDGQFLINYDAGHFFLQQRFDSLTHIVRLLMDKIGKKFFKRFRNHEEKTFVKEKDFMKLIKLVGFEILDDKIFNTPLKSVFKLVPEDKRIAFMGKWYDLEMWLNSVNIKYDDSAAPLFMTRQFILKHE